MRDNVSICGTREKSSECCAVPHKAGHLVTLQMQERKIFGRLSTLNARQIAFNCMWHIIKLCCVLCEIFALLHINTLDAKFLIK